MRDPLLHVPLGLWFGIMCMLAFQYLGAYAVPTVGTFFLYLRELTQIQSKYYDNKFYKGWLMVNPSGYVEWHKHVEWVMPGGIMFVIFYLLEKYSG